MLRWFRSCFPLAVIAGLGAAAPACQATPAPYGEVFLVVDTDVPVAPDSVVSSLRVDLYDASGTWFQSRTLTKSSAGYDWPVSFSVYGSDPDKDTRVVARLRAYPENVERDYLGEQFAPRPTYTPPSVALTAREVCDDAQPLVLGESLTLRRGPLVVDALEPQSDCGPKAVTSGSIAAALTIAQAGTYHVEVVQAVPNYTDTALVVRRTCSDPSTQIACNDDIGPNDALSFLEVPLDVGTYSVHVLGVGNGLGTEYDGPADITLRATLASDWSSSSAAASAAASNEPRLVAGGVDVTPPTEPVPGATIDRLVLLHVQPGVRSTAYVVLRGNCAGTMPELSTAAPHQKLALGEASTCVDTENTRVLLTDEPTMPGIVPIGSLPDHRLEFVDGLGCPDASKAPRSGTVCVPGGAMIFGEADLSGRGPGDAVPERLVKLTPFWMDLNELTVAEWRSAVAAGFTPDTPADANDGPLAATSGGAFLTGCSYSTAPLGREDYAVTCVSPESAREFCQWRGGDLPTEAQWEYAASDASYWGGAKSYVAWQGAPMRPDRCDIAVFGRDDAAFPETCYSASSSDPNVLGFGPLPVTARTAMADTTHLGLIGMGGGVSEFTRDAFESYASPCWAGSSLVDPSCSEPFAPQIATRGASWDTDGDTLLVAFRTPFAAGFGAVDTGFRCIYAVR